MNYFFFLSTISTGDYHLYYYWGTIALFGWRNILNAAMAPLVLLIVSRFVIHVVIGIVIQIVTRIGFHVVISVNIRSVHLTMTMHLK